jgi:hypothetical protein
MFGCGAFLLLGLFDWYMRLLVRGAAEFLLTTIVARLDGKSLRVADVSVGYRLAAVRFIDARHPLSDDDGKSDDRSDVSKSTGANGNLGFTGDLSNKAK